MIEPLEPRRMLDGASLKKGILHIDGTDAADDIALVQKRETDFDSSGNVFFVNHLLVTVNGDFQGDFSYTDIKKVVVKLMGGNDVFIVGKKLLRFDIDG